MGVTRRYNADGTKFEPPPATKEGCVVYLAGPKLQKTVKRSGSGGFPGAGDEVSVHYVGTLDDGTVFDSSRKRKKPFKFVLGQMHVISGWEQCLETMAEGELVELKCAPEFAYGALGSPPSIPPNATLTFEIELLEFKSLSLFDIAMKSGLILALMLAVLFLFMWKVVLS